MKVESFVLVLLTLCVDFLREKNEDKNTTGHVQCPSPKYIAKIKCHGLLIVNL